MLVYAVEALVKVEVMMTMIMNQFRMIITNL